MADDVTTFDGQKILRDAKKRVSVAITDFLKGAEAQGSKGNGGHGSKDREIQKISKELDSARVALKKMAERYDAHRNLDGRLLGEFGYQNGYVQELADELAKRVETGGTLPDKEKCLEQVTNAYEQVSSVQDLLNSSPYIYRGQALENLEKSLSTVLAVVGFLGTYFFLSPSMSGYVVSAGASTMSYSIAGIILFLLGVFGVWNYTRLKNAGK